MKIALILLTLGACAADPVDTPDAGALNTPCGPEPVEPLGTSVAYQDDVVVMPRTAYVAWNHYHAAVRAYLECSR